VTKSLVYMCYFVLYTFFILWFGKSGFNKTRSTRDFYIANGSLGLFTSISTFGGTWFSAASMLGLTGSIYAFGYSAILYSVIGWFFGAFLIVLLANKFKEYSIVTMPEFFKIRYGSTFLQAAGGLVIVIGYVFYIVIQIKGFGIIMTKLLDIPYSLAIFLVYLFILYTTFGGLYSVARTDIINFLLIVFGSLLSGFIIWSKLDGLQQMHLQAAVIDTEVIKNSGFYTIKGGLLDPFAKGLQPPILLISSFFGWGLGLAANPQYAIRISSARDKKTALNMVGITILILILVYFSNLIIGLGSRILVPTAVGINSIDEIFPYIIDTIFSTHYGGLILISIIAAAISSANSQLLILASGFCNDIYKNLFNPSINDEKFLNLNRFFVGLGGTTSLLLALNPPASLLIFGAKIWGVFAAVFLIPLYGGVFWSKATKAGALAAFIGGLVTSLPFYIAKVGYKAITPITTDYVVNPALPGVIASLILFILVSLLTQNRGGRMQL